MSKYNSNHFSCQRGIYNSTGITEAPAVHGYGAINDEATLADVEGANYFSANFGFEEGNVAINDFIKVVATDGSAEYIVTGVDPAEIEAVDLNFGDITATSITLATTGGTPTPLNYYEEGSFNVTWSGARTNTVAVGFVRVGKQVTLRFPTNTGPSAGAGQIDSAVAVPARLRPALESAQVIVSGIDNSVNTYISLYVYSTGNLQFAVGAGASNFAATGNCGYFQTEITYITA